jgi:hypothetical protein
MQRLEGPAAAYLGLGDNQQVVVALELFVVISITLTPVVLLLKPTRQGHRNLQCLAATVQIFVHNNAEAS